MYNENKQASDVLELMAEARILWTTDKTIDQVVTQSAFLLEV